MDGLEHEYQGRLQVVRLNFIDERNQKAIKALGVLAHPTIALIGRDGTRQPLLLGPQSIEKMRPLVDALTTP